MSESAKKSGKNPTITVCLVIPAYNHAQPLRPLLHGAIEILPHIIVVDNGSTDDTGRVLAEFPGVRVIRSRRNRGKGRALAAGMGIARRQGFSHAITMDANGHLVPEDLCSFLNEIHSNPDALIIGARELPQDTWLALGARLLRAISNTWVWMQTGHWFRDACSGFRAYPLEPLSLLVLRRVHYEFEIEALVKSVWAGTPVKEIPVRATLLRRQRSHFRPLHDTWRLLRLLVALLWQRIALPVKVRAMMHLKVFGRLPRRQRIVTYLRGFILQETESPREVGFSLGIGVCLGILPIWGFQMIAAYFVANITKLSKPLMITATGLSLGPALPVILYLSLLIGNLVVDGRLDFDLGLSSMSSDTFWSYLVEYIVGACILGAATGFLAGFAGYRIAKAYLEPKDDLVHE